MKIKYLILTLFLIAAGKAFAQQPKFTASVDKNTVATGGVIEVSFTVNANGEQFSPPDFRGFEVVGNSSQSSESIGGNTSVSIAYSFELMAVKEGDFTIGPASIVVNGRKL